MSKNLNNDEKKSDMGIITKTIPKYGIWTAKDKVKLQIALPGVNKDQIKMKALKDCFSLRAFRDDIEFSLDLDIGVKIKPEETDVKYEEGLLNIEFKRYNPLEEAYVVKIE